MKTLEKLTASLNPLNFFTPKNNENIETKKDEVVKSAIRICETKLNKIRKVIFGRNMLDEHLYLLENFNYVEENPALNEQKAFNFCIYLKYDLENNQKFTKKMFNQLKQEHLGSEYKFDSNKKNIEGKVASIWDGAIKDLGDGEVLRSNIKQYAINYIKLALAQFLHYTQWRNAYIAIYREKENKYSTTEADAEQLKIEVQKHNFLVEVLELFKKSLTLTAFLAALNELEKKYEVAYAGLSSEVKKILVKIKEDLKKTFKDDDIIRIEAKSNSDLNSIKEKKVQDTEEEEEEEAEKSEGDSDDNAIELKTIHNQLS